jgi:hypothetical protein
MALCPWCNQRLVRIARPHALTVGDLKAAVDDLGLVPAQLARYGGVTFVTSFFLPYPMTDWCLEMVGGLGICGLCAISRLLRRSRVLLCHSSMP